jgi:hypothetical protein
MRPQTRTLFAILFGVPVLMVLALAFVGASVLCSGTVEVHVREKRPAGQQVDVLVPAAFLPAAMRFTPLGAMASCHIEPEARRAIRVAAKLLKAMEDAPDGVYVDVRTRDEVVLIEKKDGTISVDVDTASDVVHASAPLKAVRSVLRAI